MFNLKKLFLKKGYCDTCINRGKGKCVIIEECVNRRRQRKDKGVARVKKEVSNAL